MRQNLNLGWGRWNQAWLFSWSFWFFIYCGGMASRLQPFQQSLACVRILARVCILVHPASSVIPSAVSMPSYSSSSVIFFHIVFGSPSWSSPSLPCWRLWPMWPLTIRRESLAGWQPCWLSPCQCQLGIPFSMPWPGFLKPLLGSLWPFWSIMTWKNWKIGWKNQENPNDVRKSNITPWRIDWIVL